MQRAKTMSEQGRSLSEIAYDTYSIPNYPIDPSVIDAALIEVGIDPQDQRERTRFQRMVEANAPLHRLDAEAVNPFAVEARKHLGNDAEFWRIMELASEIKRCHEAEMDDYEDKGPRL